jgi:hypothetical protein
MFGSIVHPVSTHAAALRRTLAACLIALASISPSDVARAQAAATLTGRITDSAGNPIAGASVRVPQLEKAAAVDSTGQYRLEGLPTGRFTIVAEARGFAGKRAEVTIPANGTVEQTFSLAPNAHVLSNVVVRARQRRQLSLQLHEFEQRQHSSRAGRFLGPDDLVKWNGRPLSDAIRTIMAGARFQRNAVGELIMVSSRSLNPASIGGSSDQRRNIKPCGIQVWQDGALLSDPNQSLEAIVEPKPGKPVTYSTYKIGADHDYDISNLLTDNYAAVEYYSDLASTPPGFRTGTPNCGTLVLWSRMPATRDTETTRQQPDTSTSH